MNKYDLYKAAYEQFADTAVSQYKLIYEKAGNIYGSISGLPTEHDFCFTQQLDVTPVVVEATSIVEPVVLNEPDEIPVTEIPTAEIPVVEVSATINTNKRRARKAAIEETKIVVEMEPENATCVAESTAE